MIIGSIRCDGFEEEENITFFRKVEIFASCMEYR